MLKLTCHRADNDSQRIISLLEDNADILPGFSIAECPRHVKMTLEDTEAPLIVWRGYSECHAYVSGLINALRGGNDGN